MSWQGIEGHDDVVELFRRAIARGRLASTFLFVGPAGIGKRRFAERLAQTLLCPHADNEKLIACQHCDSCVQAAAESHPDLIRIAKPADKSTIPVSVFIGEGNRRMREGLCHDIAMKPFGGGRKVAIIDDADYLNEEGANCLLKTLEEPPPRSILILIGTSADRQLPTIRSRAQTIRFQPLAESIVAERLLHLGLATDESEARRLAGFSGGSLQRAMELTDDGLWEFRRELFRALSASRLANVPLAASLISFVEAAGKEASSRRNRARQAIAFAIEFYRQMLRVRAGQAPQGDDDLLTSLQRASKEWPGDEETATACIERSLEAHNHIERNAHQTTLLECWLDDLARIVQSGYGVAPYKDATGG